MKKSIQYLTLILFALSGSLSLYAQSAEEEESCESVRKSMGYAYFYCDCHENAVPFHFPLDTTISDTTWFQATFDDIRQGLCAYWFANSSVTFEIYPYCSLATPLVQMTVGRDRMKEMDTEAVNQKLAEAGKYGEMIAGSLKPYIRVYPNGGEGRVLCYPYNQGPHSTCDTLLRLVNGMTYVRNEHEDIYELQKNVSRPHTAIRWKQDKDSACTLYFTKDSCNGAIVAGPVTLTDSMHLWLPDSTTMALARNNYPLYLHATSGTNLAGRLTFYTNYKTFCDTVDTVFCEGHALRLGQRIFTRDTMVYDTTHFSNDTLRCTRYNITVTQPTPQNKTLNLKQSQLPYKFEGIYYVTDFGQDTAVIAKTGECTQIYHLTVNHKIDTKTVTTDTTICVGKTITLSGVTYSQGTITLRDTTMRDADTRVITLYTIRFIEPEMEYDTLRLEAYELVDGYRYQGQYLYDYGTDTLTISKRETCTRIISVTVEQPQKDEPQNYQQDQATAPKRAYKVIRGGQIYIVRDGIWYNLVGTKNED